MKTHLLVRRWFQIAFALFVIFVLVSDKWFGVPFETALGVLAAGTSVACLVICVRPDLFPMHWKGPERVPLGRLTCAGLALVFGIAATLPLHAGWMPKPVFIVGVVAGLATADVGGSRDHAAHAREVARHSPTNAEANRNSV